MNRIFLSDDQYAAGGPVKLSPRQSAHVLNVLRKQVGETLRIGQINGPHGSGRILSIADGAVAIDCDWAEDALASAEPTVDLLLALPRPKVLKRLLPVLGSLGLGRIWLTNAAKVEANYFATHWLEPAALEDRLLEGLEQSGQTARPVVEVVRRLKPLVEDRIMDEYAPQQRNLLHPAGGATAWRELPASGSVLLAVGPEGGWSQVEVDWFENCGFARLSLGRHILRSDVACTAAIASLRMARRLTQ